MKKVVAQAATSDLCEQPSYYDTLCGEGRSNRVGDDRCLEPETNLTVYFLDRDRSLPKRCISRPLWQQKNVRTKQGCLVLHNNWISGRLKKLERHASVIGPMGLLISAQGCVRYEYKLVNQFSDLVGACNIFVRVSHWLTHQTKTALASSQPLVRDGWPPWSMPNNVEPGHP